MMVSENQEGAQSTEGTVHAWKCKKEKDMITATYNIMEITSTSDKDELNFSFLHNCGYHKLCVDV